MRDARVILGADAEFIPAHSAENYYMKSFAHWREGFDRFIMVLKAGHLNRLFSVYIARLESPVINSLPVSPKETPMFP